MNDLSLPSLAPLPAMADVPLGAEDIATMDLISSEINIDMEVEDLIDEGQFLQRYGSTLIEIISDNSDLKEVLSESTEVSEEDRVQMLQILVIWTYKWLMEDKWFFSAEIAECTPNIDVEEEDNIIKILALRVPLFEAPNRNEHEDLTGEKAAS